MENILIFDEFLEKDDLVMVLKDVKMKTFMYGSKSGGSEVVDTSFFSSPNFEYLFNNYIKNKLEERLARKFSLDRHYMNAQTFGQDGAYHIDHNRFNKFTFCLYLNELPQLTEIEELNCGGEFFIKLPREKSIISVAPKMNRGVFFPSIYVHKGSAFNNWVSGRRICLTWKLEDIGDIEETQLTGLQYESSINKLVEY